jgi:hypothetical protein
MLDDLADAGITVDDVRELIRKVESTGAHIDRPTSIQYVCTRRGCKGVVQLADLSVAFAFMHMA